MVLIGARLSLRLGTVKCLWCQADLAAYKRVICVTVCAVTGAGKKHVLEACAPDDDHVGLPSARHFSVTFPPSVIV